MATGRGFGGRRRKLDRRVAFAVLAVAGQCVAPRHCEARDLVPRWPLQTVHVDRNGSTAEDLVDRDRRRLPVERLGEPRELPFKVSGHSPPPTPTAGERAPARNLGAPSTPSPRAPLPPHAACTRTRPPTRPHTAELPTSARSPARDPARTSRPATQHPAPARPRGRRCLAAYRQRPPHPVQVSDRALDLSHPLPVLPRPRQRVRRRLTPDHRPEPAHKGTAHRGSTSATNRSKSDRPRSIKVQSISTADLRDANPRISSTRHVDGWTRCPPRRPSPRSPRRDPHERRMPVLARRGKHRSAVLRYSNPLMAVTGSSPSR